MKRILCAILCAAFCIGLCSCGTSDAPDDRGLQVVTTLFPYYDFARQIGGEDINVTLLVPAGRETHSFEPTPMDVVTVSEADVFLYNGGESEYWVDEILESSGDNIPVVVRGMDLLDEMLEEEAIVDGQVAAESGHNEDKEYDEHIWTSPVVAMTLCRGICQALCQADMAHAGHYRQRTEAYLSQLEALDAEFRDVVASGIRSEIVFGDRFPLLYFAREYGLTYSAAFHGCSSDTEPSLATLKNLIDEVNAHNIPVIYTIELSSGKVANAIAEATGSIVLSFHSCQSVTRQEFDAGETYLSLMQKNVIALQEGLS